MNYMVSYSQKYDFYVFAGWKCLYITNMEKYLKYYNLHLSDVTIKNMSEREEEYWNTKKTEDKK
jgi:hypothetical protein